MSLLRFTSVHSSHTAPPKTKLTNPLHLSSLDYHVQSCCNTSKFVATRLSGSADVFFADDEKTFADLQARIAATIELLQSVAPETFEGKEDQALLVEKKAYGAFSFTGQSYVSEFAIPNFHFHLSTAYCLLRHQGVALDAMDYLRGVLVKV